MSLFILISFFVFSISYIIILKRYLNNNYKIMTLLVSFIFATEVLIYLYDQSYSPICTYFYLLIVTYLIDKHQKNIILSFNYSISAIYCMQIFVTIMSSLAAFLFSLENTFYNVYFNIIMQISVLILAIFLHKKRILDKLIPISDKSTIVNIINNFVFIVILNHILPFFYDKMNNKVYYLISLLFILYSFLSKMLINIYNRIDIALINNNNELELIKSKSAATESKHQEIIKLKVCLSKIIKKIIKFMDLKDISGLINYIDEEVSQVYIRFVFDQAEMKQIELIKGKILKALISEFIYKISNCSNENDIQIQFAIKQFSNKIEQSSVKIYNIIKVFLDDAYEELSLLEKGNVKISLNDDYKTFTFSLISSLRIQDTIKVNDNKEYEFLENKLRKNPNVIDLYKVRDSGFLIQGIVVNYGE